MMAMPLHPDAVEFDAMECCAMERASAQEVHKPLIKECMKTIGEVHPVYKTSLLLGIFQHMLYLAFIPHAVHRTLYAQLATAEKGTFERLEDQLLDCGHLASEHRNALDAVWVKMQS